ncbi:Rieske 2Fe-2S domain-containing protein [Pontibacterium granulatum]|uniref:Rieske (2Fe-2S) protein n=1 Tax=Pontibacterium granulatum TaxID=2036029 RepID=UPI002499D758|nr:Rieske 2Fe-2S domain-containing protein [Pontibacterium granulatum]MDI3325857.1 Rieske 2Fe-2S domain-containing protein [Pontibacterium granulatum]
MSQWQDLCALDELKHNARKVITTTNGLELLLVNIEGEILAVENLCPHDNGQLHEGPIEGTDIICPRHGARFCLRTGEVLAPPATEDIDNFPTRVNGDRIEAFLP